MVEYKAIVPPYYNTTHNHIVTSKVFLPFPFMLFFLFLFCFVIYALSSYS